MADISGLIIIIVLILIIAVVLLIVFQRKQDKELKKLFKKHAVLTREFIVLSTDKKEDKIPAVVQKLMKNQENIGAFFGDTLGDKSKGAHITKLLKEHILGVAAATGAALTGTPAQLAEKVKALKANSDEVGAYFASLTKKLKTDDVQQMFWHHNQLALKQVIARRDKQMKEDAKLYKQYTKQLLSMASQISNAL